MIFVTVGTELSFDRLVGAVDRWAKENDYSDVFAQIGEKGSAPEFIDYAHFIEPADFTEKFKQASVIVAHAGMGSILTALHHQKPIIVMPRKASLGEQRNEHQLATAKHMSRLGKVVVSYEEEDLHRMLNELEALTAKQPIGKYASEGLLNAVQHFVTSV